MDSGPLATSTPTKTPSLHGLSSQEEMCRAFLYYHQVATNKIGTASSS
jgi:hypothetical protein